VTRWGCVMNFSKYLKMALVFAAAVIGASATGHAEYKPINRGDSKSLILFVHGLWSDPATAFKDENTKLSWPEMMANDSEGVRGQIPLSRFAIGTLSYPASKADRLTIPQIATQLLIELTDTGVFEKYENIIFVTHSMGGLVVKQMLVDATSSEQHAVRERTRAVFLISTPSKGSPAANFVRALPKIATGPLVFDLKPISENTYLQDLDNHWENFLRSRRSSVNLTVFCAYETMATSGITVVPEQYTSTICDQTPFPVNSDHIQIVKPTSTQSVIYTWVRGRIAEISRSMTPPTSSASPLSSASTQGKPTGPQSPAHESPAGTITSRSELKSGDEDDKLNRKLTEYITNEYLRDRERFTEYVDYYTDGRVPRSFVIRDKRRYAARWSSQTYKLVPGSLKVIQRSTDKIVVLFSFRYNVVRSTGSLTGGGTQEVTLVPDSKSFLVSGVKVDGLDRDKRSSPKTARKTPPSDTGKGNFFNLLQQ